MRIGIDVNNRSEADAARWALDNPVLKTVLLINALLQELEEPAERERALDMVQKIHEPQFLAAEVAKNNGRPEDAALRLRDGAGPD